MKKSIAAIAILSSAAMAASASASLLIYEPFNSTGQTPGAAIAGTNPTTPATGTWWSAGTATSPVHQVASGSLTYPSFPASVGNEGDLKGTDQKELLRTNIPNAFDSNSHPIYAGGSTLYYSLLINVPSTSGLTVPHSNVNANNAFLASFNNTQQSANVTGEPNAWNGELVMRLGSDTSDYNLGIRGSTTTASTTYFTGDLTPGATYLVVVEASINSGATDGLNTIWVDPDPSSFGGATPSDAAGAIGYGSSNGLGNSGGTWNMQAFMIGAGESTAHNGPNDVYMDEIRVGDSWADVTAVPEPTALGLLGMGAMALVSRRKRQE